ncbi:MAG: hypothetical protein QFX35_00075 [Candidatus Verstraetearchaeota archaeon]|nr:hypothetical protein [Candidatus Verstraetearchaeota archaeon]
MQLGTFGAILKFASELEDAAANFYEEAAKRASSERQKLFSELSNASKKNKQMIDRTRRMEMQEMILEAITGIDSDNYKTDKDVAPDESANLRKAVEIESKAKKFYEDSMEKLGFLPNVKKTFAKLASEKQDRLNKLKSC